jgi:hypothetical protein
MDDFLIRALKKLSREANALKKILDDDDQNHERLALDVKKFVNAASFALARFGRS